MVRPRPEGPCSFLLTFNTVAFEIPCFLAFRSDHLTSASSATTEPREPPDHQRRNADADRNVESRDGVGEKGRSSAWE